MHSVPELPVPNFPGSLGWNQQNSTSTHFGSSISGPMQSLPAFSFGLQAPHTPWQGQSYIQVPGGTGPSSHLARLSETSKSGGSPSKSRESKAAKDLEERRSRGRPRGSKDKNPRTRRGGNGQWLDSEPETVPPRTQPVPPRSQTDLPRSEAQYHPLNCTESMQTDPPGFGRRKPWKIVLTTEDALDIYKSRKLGLTNASLSANLGQRYSVNAKVRILGRRGCVKHISICFHSTIILLSDM